MTKIIYATQAVLAVMCALWTYDRYAKRWPATLGNDVVTGSVQRADFVLDGHIGQWLVSYGYEVRGRRYFDSFEARDFKARTNEAGLEKFRESYPIGYGLTVFYWKEDPSVHWLHKPPSTKAVFSNALDVPLLVLVLTNVPLLFVHWLISMQAG